MSNMLTNNYIGYKGKINLKLKIQDKIYSYEYHNEGTKFLYDTITMALAGREITNRIPAFFTLVKRVENTYYPLLYRATPLTGIVYDYNSDAVLLTDTQSVLLMNSLVTAENRCDISELPEDTRIEAHLLSRNGEVIAKISNQNLVEAYNGLADGTEIIVEWQMIFDSAKE